MERPRNSMSRLFAAALAVALVGWLPGQVDAKTVVFRNECRAAIVIQAATVVRGVMKREQPYLLKAGETTPKISITTDKIIMIYDGKANKMLFRDVLKASAKPLYYSVAPDPRTGKVRMVPRSAAAMMKPGGGK